ncbi:MAG: 1-acyl-sn-glycerol-3-phosphate acyltransferase [Rhodocyclaceae bacterium]|nr:1-acyl-sn-glycerol-3-phosphate acyltransferase [Rhodocyclaceae bacterium]
MNTAPPFPVTPRRWAALILKRAGWTLELPTPPGPKLVLLMYPHTSNWDFVLGLLARFACGWPVRWIGKHSLFRPPFGALLRRLGGIAVDRAQPGSFVDDVIAHCRAAPHIVLVIAPEGTRSYVDGWKRGFHRIAHGADIPIGLGYIDYRQRRIGIAGYVPPTDDIDADLAAIRAGYAPVSARYPDKAGPINLRG